MFGETWEWAGEYRKSDKSISPFHWTEVPRLLSDLFADTRVQNAHSAKTPDELGGIAVRFHHKLVQIHPWPNGNGRHGRLATDLLLRNWGRTPFSWGGATHWPTHGELRAHYLKALRAAGAGAFDALHRFVRS
jgi:fido (protein-threonine AMPylation protein)